MKNGPRLPQLEKALAQKWRPNTAINKKKKQKQKQKQKNTLVQQMIVISTYRKTEEKLITLLEIYFYKGDQVHQLHFYDSILIK